MENLTKLSELLTVDGKLKPEVEKIIRFTIQQWTSLDEQRESDHEQLILDWINYELKDKIIEIDSIRIVRAMFKNSNNEPKNMENKTLLDFKNFIEETIPQQLFHVEYDDKHESGGRLEEVILINLIANNIWLLSFRPLQWFLNRYLTHTKIPNE